MPPTPLPHGTSSYVDFDPREPAKPARDGGVEFTPLGDHAGFRVRTTGRAK